MGERLYRSQTDRIIGGVCGGLGEYLRIDTTVIRLLFVLLALGSGVGLMVYLVMWLVVPAEGTVSNQDTLHENAGEIAARTRTFGADLKRSLRNPDRQTGLFIGAGLVSLGFIFLCKALGLPLLRSFNLGVWWPVILIVLGVLVVLRRSRDR